MLLACILRDRAAAVAAAVSAPGKVVCAVCHGPAGLVMARDGDKPLVAGKKVTAFNNTEEEAVGKTKVGTQLGHADHQRVSLVPWGFLMCSNVEGGERESYARRGVWCPPA
jgi:putative intracellular protease/amidase